MMKKRILALVLAATLLLSLAGAAAAEEADTRVFDYAGLFSQGEAEDLRAAIIDFQENTGYDFAVLVTDVDHGYDDYQELCDDFYQSKSLGFGMNRTAILCYLDLFGDGYYYISVYGDLKNLMVAEDVQYLAENGMDYFERGDFTGGFTWTVTMLSEALLNIGRVSEQRVYDYAEMFSDEETAALEQAILQFRSISGMDFVYLSTYDELQGNENGDYMVEFYAKHGFGAGEQRSGVMIYLDLYLGNFFIQNFGDMDQYVSQESLTTILQNMNELMSEGKILQAVQQMLGNYSAYFE